jgi:mRNA interferase MazF
MDNTNNFGKWDIVLIQLPNHKKRPALIISPERHNLKHDIIVLFITSNIDVKEELSNYTIIDWKSAGLPKPAMIKMNFSTVKKNHMKKIGKLGQTDVTNFEKKFADFFNIN